GLFPITRGMLYLPAPNDCVVEEVEPNRFAIHRATPADFRDGEGCDWPGETTLKPVLLNTDRDFKPKDGPTWWPVERVTDWITRTDISGFTLDSTFLKAAESEVRDHVQLDPDTGAAAESRLFATAGLALTHLPRFGAERTDKFP